jgi:signal transduction histidine kinase
VEALGGTFGIDSPQGAGTRVAATIPATPPVEQ